MDVPPDQTNVFINSLEPRWFFGAKGFAETAIGPHRAHWQTQSTMLAASESESIPSRKKRSWPACGRLNKSPDPQQYLTIESNHHPIIFI